MAARMFFTVDQYLAIPAEEAYAILCDWENHGRWMPFTRIVAGSTDEFTASIGAGPFRIVHRMKVRERVDGDLRITLEENGPLLLGSSTLSTRRFDRTSCVVRWSEDVHAPAVPGLLSRPLTIVTKFFVRRALRRLPGLR